MEEMNYFGQRVQTSSNNMNETGGSHVQHNDYSYWYCVTYLKFAEGVDLSCSQHPHMKRYYRTGWRCELPLR